LKSSLNVSLALEIIWFDDDVIQLYVRCDNGRFAGSADCYAAHGVFAELSVAVSGFPASTDDRRAFELGAFEPGCAGGGLRLRLRCVDPVGHSVADVRIRSPLATRTGRYEETAEFSFPVEAVAIDEFVAGLGKMQIAVGAAVALRQAI
jgi:hypothetical protein